MREILFRGIIKNDNSRYKRGQWAVGDLVRLQDGNDGKPHIYGCGEVLAETVGQYTGLTDKNGTKIFEGDILKFAYNEEDENPIFYSVEWKSDRACFGYAETSDKMLEVDAFRCEVIGNIHDDPELLKECEGK